MKAIEIARHGGSEELRIVERPEPVPAGDEVFYAELTAVGPAHVVPLPPARRSTLQQRLRCLARPRGF